MRLIGLYIVGLITAACGTPANVTTAGSATATAFSAQSANTGQLAPSRGLAISRAEDGLFYLDGMAGSEKVRFLVDTGATHVVLSHADARRARGVPITAADDVIMTAGGAENVDWVVIAELEIRGEVLRHVKAAVPRRDTGLSLLGQNALTQFEVLRIDGDRLTLSR
jgi:aspartyl protease family protein